MTITRSLILMAVLLGIYACRTNNSMSKSAAAPPSAQPGQVLTDRDGNKYSTKAFPDDNLWMTTNLKLNVSGSYCYENKKENCDRYGRLYTWAVAKDVCKQLGEEWRLPSAIEWERLAEMYGGVFRRDSAGSGKNAYKALVVSGNSQLNIQLGGGQSGNQYRRIDAHGFYWTATEVNDSTAWFYNFGKNSQTLYQQNDGEKTNQLSVRCVKTNSGSH